MQTEKIELTTRLADYRKSKGYSQDQLAKIIGVTTATIQNWENGRGMGSVTRIMKLCVALDADATEIFPVKKLSSGQS